MRTGSGAVVREIDGSGYLAAALAMRLTVRREPSNAETSSELPVRKSACCFFFFLILRGILLIPLIFAP